jgi:hypothetical protein
MRKKLVTERKSPMKTSHSEIDSRAPLGTRTRRLLSLVQKRPILRFAPMDNLSQTGLTNYVILGQMLSLGPIYCAFVSNTLIPSNLLIINTLLR